MLYEQLKNGLVVPISFAESAPEMREVATTTDGRDITRGFVSPLLLLQPQDTVLQARGGGNYEIYREVLRDDQVKATFEQRRLAVVSREWEVQPGGDKRIDKKAADALEEQLNHIGWDGITDKMLYGVFYGYGVAECLFARDGAQVVLDQLRVRDRRRFAFDGAARLRLLTSSNASPGELLPERKFWAFCTGADHDDEPYGLGLAHWLYWPVFFKRGGMKFWLIFLEKFGQPTAKGSYPRNATPAEKAKLLSALEAIATDSGVIVPEGMAIDLIEAARSGTADYTALHDRMNAAIAKVALGQTLTTEAAGGQYKADVQMDVRQDLVKADSDLVCESFNRGPARWLTDWNFPGAAYPRVWRRIDDEPDLKPLAERDKTIVDMGFKPTLKYVHDTYGGEWTEKQPPPAGDEPGAPPLPDVAAAFAEQQATETNPAGALTENLGRAAADPLRAWLEQIRALADRAESLEELRDLLLEAYGDLPSAELARVMALAFEAADAGGRFDAAAEAGLLPLARNGGV